MKDDVRQFLLDSLREMNYSTDGVTDETTLGPAGMDLESLAVAELAVRVEDRFDVSFSEEEAEEMAGMTLGEFVDAVVARGALADSASRGE